MPSWSSKHAYTCVSIKIISRDFAALDQMTTIDVENAKWEDVLDYENVTVEELRLLKLRVEQEEERLDKLEEGSVKSQREKIRLDTERLEKFEDTLNERKRAFDSLDEKKGNLSQLISDKRKEIQEAGALVAGLKSNHQPLPTFITNHLLQNLDRSVSPSNVVALQNEHDLFISVTSPNDGHVLAEMLFPKEWVPLMYHSVLTPIK